MKSAKKPFIAITMGDATGIGPEIIIKSLLKNNIYRICYPIVIGESRTMSKTIKALGLSLQLNIIEHAEKAVGQPGTIDIIDLKNLDEKDIMTGKICPACGRAAMEYIERAAELSLTGEIQAIVTAPINKEATIQAGYGDIGHLEFLARLTKTTDYATMLVAGSLRVVHLTTHYSLRDAVKQVTKDRILSKLKLTHRSFQVWGFSRPRIGVAALNPHGSESGLFGREEIDQIAPAIKAAKAMGIDARGPFPADSIFNRAINGEFDAVLAMYHDQGHIPIKVHNFEKSISVALGLPFIRTSVDHGTAFDIAGKGIASSISMEEATKVAASLARKGLPDPSVSH
jgi:4-hydroxythreonine-4-phosphate dehydrogenase